MAGSWVKSWLLRECVRPPRERANKMTRRRGGTLTDDNDSCAKAMKK